MYKELLEQGIDSWNWQINLNNADGSRNELLLKIDKEVLKGGGLAVKINCGPDVIVSAIFKLYGITDIAKLEEYLYERLYIKLFQAGISRSIQLNKEMNGGRRVKREI